MESPAAPTNTDLRLEFASLAEWQAFCAAQPAYLDQAFIASVADRIRSNGFDFTFINYHVQADEMIFIGDNYRETIVFRGINARNRAVLDELIYRVGDAAPASYRIYSPEALSPFALMVRGRFPRFVGSEYTDDPAMRSELYPIEVQDLLALTLRSDSFDAVVVNDVFEHLPDIPAGLGEITKILKCGGVLISTFPFAAFSQHGPIKAKRTISGDEHFDRPEYHDDPMRPGGALVYQIPGWDILDACRTAGLSSARMVYVFSERRGIIAPHFGGVFILAASK
jgi:SAM-dependent methyltransferase